MRKTVQLNCRNFSCKFNDEGKCGLDMITLQDDGSPILNQVICLEAEPKVKETKPIDPETAWGEPEENLPEQKPKDYFAPQDEMVH